MGTIRREKNFDVGLGEISLMFVSREKNRNRWQDMGQKILFVQSDDRSDDSIYSSEGTCGWIYPLQGGNQERGKRLIGINVHNWPVRNGWMSAASDRYSLLKGVEVSLSVKRTKYPIHQAVSVSR